MPEYKLDFSNVDRVENDIHVKFNNVITMPVHCDGKDTGIAIYLGITNIAAWARKHNANPYAYDGPLNAEQLMDIAGRLSLVAGD